MPPRVVTARSIELQVRANQLTRMGPSGPSSATQHEDEEFLVFINAAQDLVPAADHGLTAPDAIEREGAFEPERLALPEADPAFDEDLSDLPAEIAAGELTPVA